jgi:hypothetical protein
LNKELSRRGRIDSPLENHTWDFIGRLPHANKKLTDYVKMQIEQFWNSHSRVSLNVKDVLKL